MEVEETRPKDGLRSYYVAKIEELLNVVNEKSQDVRRLEAQRNELNAKGTYMHDIGREQKCVTILHGK